MKIRFGNGDLLSTASGDVVLQRGGPTPVTMQTSVVCPHTGAEFFFVAVDGVTPEARQVGQHVCGDWFVIADVGNPVRIGNITPAFRRGTGTVRQWSVTTEGDLWINGAMLNPRRIVRHSTTPGYVPLASEGQGFSSYYYDPGLLTQGNLLACVDPGYTAAPLVLSGDGDIVVKALCNWLDSPPTLEQTGGDTKISSLHQSFAALTVRHEIPVVGSFRPCGNAEFKAETMALAIADIDFTKFNRHLDQSDLSPYTFANVADRFKFVSSYGFAYLNDNSRNVRAEPVEGRYDRNEVERFARCFCSILRAPTTGDDSDANRRQAIAALTQYALDCVSDIASGLDRNSGSGYGQGWKTVATFLYLALKLPWVKTLLTEPVPNPVSGVAPAYYKANPGNYAERPEFGVMNYGTAEYNRFFNLTATYVGYDFHDISATAGRGYAKAFQATDIGRPVWFGTDQRFFPQTSKAKMLGDAGIRKAYFEMQGVQYSPFIGLFTMRGGREAFNQDVALQVLDRISHMKGLALLRSEAGFTGENLAFANKFRDTISLPRWAGAPESHVPPLVEGYVGDPTIIRVRPVDGKQVAYGHAITRHDLRYTSTQPSTYDYAEAIWTQIDNVTFAPDYLITGLTYPEGTRVYVQYGFWTSQGFSGWSQSHRINTRNSVTPEGTKGPALGPYEDPEGPQASIVISAPGNIVNTVSPSILGAPTVGQELVFDPGLWSVEPWLWTVTWRVNGVTALTGSLATARAFTVPNSVGQTVTAEWTAANSSSSTGGTTAGLTIRAAEVLAVPLVTSNLTHSNEGLAADRTRTLPGVNDGSHPVTLLGVVVQSCISSDTLVLDQMVMRTDADVIVSNTLNLIADYSIELRAGNVPQTVSFFDVVTTTSGGTKLTTFENRRNKLTAMLAFDLTAFDMTKAVVVKDAEVLAIDPEDPESPLTKTLILRDAAGALKVMPKGSLIIAGTALSQAPGFEEVPVWSDNVQPVPGLSDFRPVSLTPGADNVMVSVATGLLAASGAVTVDFSHAQADARSVVSVLVIPPK